MPQSRAAMAVARVLAPQPGERVLDLCAAPGGKTTHLAALMEDRGAVVAVERHPGRAEALARTAARMGATSSRCAPATPRGRRSPRPTTACSSTRPARTSARSPSRPDARWRKQAALPARLAELQGAILRAGADALRPGGTLVYSTCTISPAENEDVVDRFLAERDDFAADDLGSSEWSVWQHGTAADVPADAPPPRRDGRVLHRPAAPGRPRERRRHRSRRRLPRLRRAVAAADEPARPLPLRELPAPLRAGLRVPELRRALDDRADVQHGAVRLQPLPRLDAGADLWHELVRGRAVDPVGRLRAPRRAGRGRCSRRARRSSTST